MLKNFTVMAVVTCGCPSGLSLHARMARQRLSLDHGGEGAWGGPVTWGAAAPVRLPSRERAKRRTCSETLEK